MKILIKVPRNAGWPIHWEDKITEIEIDNIRFSDGTFWGVSGDSYRVDAPPSLEKEEVTSLTKVLGFKPTKITIEG